MPKKIFDIFPPKPVPIFREEKGLIISEKKKRPEIKEKMVGGKKWWQLVLLFFISGIFLAYFQLPRAEIEIWPETKILDFREKVTADSKIELIDQLKKFIPAKIFEVENFFSQAFPASGKKEKKAEGIIRVYNNYHLPVTLRAGTRFQPPSEEVIYFLSPNKISIPAKSYQDVKVEAQYPGGKYNIRPSKFSLPGLVGTELFYYVYGESFEQMKGGGEASQVTKEDLARAEKILTERALAEGKTSLEGKISGDFVLIPTAFSQEIIEASSEKKAGEEAESFNFQVKAKSQTLTFKKSDLENLARELIISQIGQTQKLQEESLKINYSPESIDLKAGKIILDLTILAKIYSDINTATLKELLRGKSLLETKILLEDQEEIIKTQINLWPFWVKKVPENVEKIKIKINLD